MDLTTISDLISSINPVILGSIAGGTLVSSIAALYIKRNKNKFLDNTEPLGHSNDFKTLKTEDLEREFGSLTVQTKMLDEDESLFFEKNKGDDLQENFATNEPSIKFVDEASVFDCFGKQEQAIEALKKAIDLEKHDKEKIRLKILLTQYNKQKGTLSLEALITQYPSFHTKVSFGSDNTISSLLSTPVPKLIHSSPLLDKEIDIFSDLPILVDKSTNLSEISHIFSVKDPLSSTTSIFENKQTPSSENVNTAPINAHLEALDNFNADIAFQAHVEKPIDQFAWTNTPVDNKVQEATELILKELQKDAEAIDKVNETEAMDDMQKFWKEFGNMESNADSVILNSQNNTKESLLSEPIIPFFEERKEIPLSPLHNIVQPTAHVLLPLTQPHSTEKMIATDTTVPSHESDTVLSNISPIIKDTAQTETIAIKEPLKISKPYKVWANWIVNHPDKQIFRNHFINLKNPWGSSLAAEELYMGINKLSGKNIDGKIYPWVLVSVFPLVIDHK